MQDQTGADVSPEPEAEVDLNDLTAVEAASREDRPVEPEAEENEAESPPADEEDVEEKTDTPDEEPEEDSSFQKRIDKLTANWRQTERDLIAAEEEARKLRQMLDEVPKAQEPRKSLADFDYNEDAYREYLFEEAEKTATAAAEKAVERMTTKREAETVADKHAEREREFEGTVKDYREKVYDPNLRISADMAAEIRQSEIGPEVAYYLGNHPDEAAEIFNQSQRQVVRSMYAVEQKLLAAKEAAAKKEVSKAPPPPPKKVTGVEPGQKITTTSPDSDKLSDAEWFKREAARQAKLRG